MRKHVYTSTQLQCDRYAIRRHYNGVGGSHGRILLFEYDKGPFELFTTV